MRLFAYRLTRGLHIYKGRFWGCTLYVYTYTFVCCVLRQYRKQYYAFYIMLTGSAR